MDKQQQHIKLALLFSLIRQLIELLPIGTQPPYLARRLLPILANPDIPPARRSHILRQLYTEEFGELPDDE